MTSRSHLRQTRRSRLSALRLPSILGLAVLLLPSLASAQSSLPFTDLLFVERGIIGGSSTTASTSAMNTLGTTADSVAGCSCSRTSRQSQKRSISWRV